MRSPTTAGPPNPRPASFEVQARSGPPAGQVCSKPVSRETASRFGPRHCGQSAAKAMVAERKTASANDAFMAMVLGTGKLGPGELIRVLSELQTAAWAIVTMAFLYNATMLRRPVRILGRTLPALLVAMAWLAWWILPERPLRSCPLDAKGMWGT